MKKRLLAVITAGIVCGMSFGAGATDVDFGELFSSLEEMYSDPIESDINMPEKFSITYEYVEDGKFKEVTMEKDEMNNYHYKDSEDEFLFISDGNGYRFAIGTVSGFAYKNEDKYTFDYVKEQTSKFWHYVDPLEDEITMGTKTDEGTSEICGRPTNKYKIEWGMDYNFGGYNMSMSDATYYEMDQETGICLASSSNSDVSVMGISSSDEGTEGFECIRFELEDVTLPEIQ